MNLIISSDLLELTKVGLKGQKRGVKRVAKKIVKKIGTEKWRTFDPEYVKKVKQLAAKVQKVRPGSKLSKPSAHLPDVETAEALRKAIGRPIGSLKPRPVAAPPKPESILKIGARTIKTMVTQGAEAQRVAKEYYIRKLKGKGRKK